MEILTQIIIIFKKMKYQKIKVTIKILNNFSPNPKNNSCSSNQLIIIIILIKIQIVSHNRNLNKNSDNNKIQKIKFLKKLVLLVCPKQMKFNYNKIIYLKKMN